MYQKSIMLQIFLQLQKSEKKKGVSDLELFSKNIGFILRNVF